jgi:hypothetical protein
LAWLMFGIFTLIFVFIYYVAACCLLNDESYLKAVEAQKIKFRRNKLKREQTDLKTIADA